MLLTAPNQGEVERLAVAAAGIRRGIPAWLTQHGGGFRDDLLGVDHISRETTSTPVIVRTPVANGVQVLDLEKAYGRGRLLIFGANDLSDEADIQARPATRKSKTSAFISDFRDLAVGDYVVHVEHGIAQYCKGCAYWMRAAR